MAPKINVFGIFQNPDFFIYFYFRETIGVQCRGALEMLKKSIAAFCLKIIKIRWKNVSGNMNPP